MRFRGRANPDEFAVGDDDCHAVAEFARDGIVDLDVLECDRTGRCLGDGRGESGRLFANAESLCPRHRGRVLLPAFRQEVQEAGGSEKFVAVHPDGKGRETEADHRIGRQRFLFRPVRDFERGQRRHLRATRRQQIDRMIRRFRHGVEERHEGIERTAEGHILKRGCRLAGAVVDGAFVCEDAVLHRVALGRITFGHRTADHKACDRAVGGIAVLLVDLGDDAAQIHAHPRPMCALRIRPKCHLAVRHRAVARGNRPDLRIGRRLGELADRCLCTSRNGKKGDRQSCDDAEAHPVFLFPNPGAGHEADLTARRRPGDSLETRA